MPFGPRVIMALRALWSRNLPACAEGFRRCSPSMPAARPASASFGFTMSMSLKIPARLRESATVYQPCSLRDRADSVEHAVGEG
jgi:hypothetical protein